MRIRGPRNNFPLVDSPRYLFIAGGIGITPILAMIRSAEASGAQWPQPDTKVYCCGPEPLLNAVEQRCTAWPKGSLHVERIVAKPLTEPVLQEAFEVHLAQSDLTLTIPPGTSVLDAIEQAGIGVLSSCGEGTCGTCETPVLDGVPDHRDSVLDQEARKANDCMMICVSRACTPPPRPRRLTLRVAGSVAGRRR